MTSTAIYLRDLYDQLEKELNQNILPFWTNQMLDIEKGGYYGQYLNEGIPVKDAPKGAVLNARILWTFSAAYQTTGNDEYLAHARNAYEYFIKHFVDKENGGIFWSVDSSGKMLNHRKQIYAQAFAVYALSEYFKASEENAAIILAIDLYNLIEKHAYDHKYNGYIEALDRDWKPLDDLRLSTKDANEPKSMNTHLHILEAYTNLYDVWKDLELKMQLAKLIKIHFDLILQSETNHFNLFFDMEWNKKSSVYSFGHDIEGAWLIRRAAEVLDHPSMKKIASEKAIAMADVTLAEGIDKDGSLYNEGTGGKVTDTDRHWWPQAEAFIGFLDAFEISKKMVYFDAARDVWFFIKEKMRHPSGEWWWLVDASYKPQMKFDLAGEWKCPYHNARMCIEGMNRCTYLLKNKIIVKNI